MNINITIEQARTIFDKWKTNFPIAAAWLKKTKAEVAHRSALVYDEPHNCGTCKKALLPGDTYYYFHYEEMYDFCSNRCLQKYYRHDEEAHQMTKDGYTP